jgi:chromate transporter
MIALLENEFVGKKAWLEKDEFLDLAAIAESTPGPIAINAATYIGYKRLGFLGAFAATLGMCLPSFTVIYLISLFFDAFLSFAVVGYAFRGIQVGVVYVIFSAGFKMLKGIKKTVFNVFVISAVMTLMVAFSLFSVKFSTVFYILICGALGVVLYLIGGFKNREGKI